MRNLSIGYLGQGNLTVADGATATGAIDITMQGSNASMTVTGKSFSGSSSTAMTTGTMGRLLQQGSSDTIVVSNGGRIVTALGVQIGGNASSLTVTDPGSTVTTGYTTGGFGAWGLYVDRGAVMTITNGGAVNSDAAFIGFANTSTGNVIVTGSGSVWNATNDISIGQNGTGSVTLTNGGTIAITTGNIVLARNSTANGTLNLEDGSTLQIGGSNGLLTQGPGHATFNWAGGTLQALGNINHLSFNTTFAAGTAGGIMDTQAFTVTHSGFLGGSGNFTKLGSGSLILDGFSNGTTGNYSGTTIINGGNLTFGAMTNNLTGNLVDNATVNFARINSGNDTFPGIISGNGQINVFGNLTLTAASNFTGNIALGTSPTFLTFTGDTSQLGGTIDTTNGVINFTQSIDSEYSGTLSGNGGMQKLGTGNLTLSGNINLPTSIPSTGGTLLISGNLANFTGNLAATSPMILNQSRNVILNTLFVFSNFTLTSGGNVTFTGSNVVSGNVTINGSNLALTNDTANITGNIASNGTLLFNQTADSSYMGSISGTGVVIQSGSATLTLGGNNVYTGNTTINGGTLQVTGNLAAASNVTVMTGGTLAGNGTVSGNVSIGSGGMLAPGFLGFGQLTVGNLALDVHGTVDMLVRDPGNYSQLSVAGPLTYSGVLAINLSSALHDGTYSLFTSSNVTGDFSQVTLSGLYSGALSECGGVWSGTFSGATFSFNEVTGQLTVSGNFPREPRTRNRPGYAAISPPPRLAIPRSVATRPTPRAMASRI